MDIGAAKVERDFISIPVQDYANDSALDESDLQEQLSFLCLDPREFSIYYNYFYFKGVFYRVDRPAFACLPTAA
jgi:hypothetical protein